MVIYYVLESDLVEYTTDTKDGKQTHKHEENEGGKEKGVGEERGEGVGREGRRRRRRKKKWETGER